MKILNIAETEVQIDNIKTQKWMIKNIIEINLKGPINTVVIIQQTIEKSRKHRKETNVVLIDI